MVTTPLLNKPVLQLGSQGATVKEMQGLVNQLLGSSMINPIPLNLDGIFGPVTQSRVKLMQELYFLVADGIVGAATWRVLFDQSNVSLPTLNIGSTGDFVKKAQIRLNRNRPAGSSVIAIDGQYGPLTENAVRQFQSNHPPLIVDGVIGRKTWKALSNRVNAL
jgi:peptidoglycan hydrolase-like protein with peptidoglycan-binding domain